MAIYKDVEALEVVAYKGESEEFDKGVTFILEKLDTLPTADVAEMKHGEWTKVEVDGNGYGQIYYQHKECPVDSTQLFPCPYEYCPNCGAKMDGGKAE